MMAETQLVTLRHLEKDIIVPEPILRACSPVLDGILRDTSPPDDGGNKVRTIDDVGLWELIFFVDMLTANSYAPTNMSWPLEKCAKNTESARHILLQRLGYSCPSFTSTTARASLCSCRRRCMRA